VYSEAGLLGGRDGVPLLSDDSKPKAK